MSFTLVATLAYLGNRVKDGGLPVNAIRQRFSLVARWATAGRGLCDEFAFSGKHGSLLG